MMDPKRVLPRSAAGWTMTVFTTVVLLDEAPGRFLGVAVWEGAGAVATWLGLRYDRRRSF